MHDPVRAPLLRGAIVSQKEKNSILKLPHPLEPVHQPSDLCVCVIQKCCERLL